MQKINNTLKDPAEIPYKSFLCQIKPYPKQEEFFLAKSRRIAYGGARGGGKSWAMRTKFVLLALSYEGIQLLLLRRTFPELRENHINPLRKELHHVARYKDSTKEFIFTNGSRIKLGYCQNEGDILQYQGQAYEVIGMEEATQFTELQYQALTESNRLSGNMKCPFTPRMYFTCNPGGVGHGWFKRLFIDKNYTPSEDPHDYTFIKSTVFDNEFLQKNNPEYIKTLESLPPLRKKAMLYGDWDVFEGQYFSEFSRSAHVCEPFSIPDEYVRFASLDYGLDMTACLWYAYPCDRKKLYIYRELYEPGLLLSDAAEKIMKFTAGEKLLYTAASPDLAGRRQDSGKSGFDIMASAGLRGLVPAVNDRIAGWRMIREYLKCSDEAGPRLQIFSSCVNLIRTLPRLTFDNNTIEDASSEPHEYTHAPDSLRYGIMSLSCPQKASGQKRKKNGSDNYIKFLES